MRNGFCFLVDKLPRAIRINGHALSLDTSTSTALSVLLYLQQETTNLEKAQFSANRLLPECKELTYNEILEQLETTEERLSSILIRYLKGYPETKSYKELHDSEKTGENASERKSNKLLSFDYGQDSDMIISAFRQVYGLSLDETRRLHWWEFLALFNSLPEEAVFSQVRQIRTMKIDPKASNERKAQIREAQRNVALVDTRSPEQKRADLQDQFNKLDL